MIDRRGGLSLACLVLWAGCALDLGPTTRSVIDRCKQPGTCALSGSARKTRGITDDTIGFRIGPGAGSIVAAGDPSAIEQSDPSTSVHMLARGSGYFRVDGADSRASDSWQWVPVSDTPTFSISVKDDGSTLEIADTTVTSSCGVAPGRR